MVLIREIRRLAERGTGERSGIRTERGAGHRLTWLFKRGSLAVGVKDKETERFAADRNQSIPIQSIPRFIFDPPNSCQPKDMASYLKLGLLRMHPSPIYHCGFPMYSLLNNGGIQYQWGKDFRITFSLLWSPPPSFSLVFLGPQTGYLCLKDLAQTLKLGLVNPDHLCLNSEFLDTISFVVDQDRLYKHAEYLDRLTLITIDLVTCGAYPVVDFARQEDRNTRERHLDKILDAIGRIQPDHSLYQMNYSEWAMKDFMEWGKWNRVRPDYHQFDSYLKLKNRSKKITEIVTTLTKEYREKSLIFPSIYSAEYIFSGYEKKIVAYKKMQADASKKPYKIMKARMQFWKLFEMEKPCQEMEKPSIIKFEPEGSMEETENSWVSEDLACIPLQSREPEDDAVMARGEESIPIQSIPRFIFHPPKYCQPKDMASYLKLGLLRMHPSPIYNFGFPRYSLLNNGGVYYQWRKDFHITYCLLWSPPPSSLVFLGPQTGYLCLKDLAQTLKLGLVNPDRLCLNSKFLDTIYTVSLDLDRLYKHAECLDRLTLIIIDLVTCGAYPVVDFARHEDGNTREHHLDKILDAIGRIQPDHSLYQMNYSKWAMKDFMDWGKWEKSLKKTRVRPDYHQLDSDLKLKNRSKKITEIARTLRKEKPLGSRLLSKWEAEKIFAGYEKKIIAYKKKQDEASKKPDEGKGFIWAWNSIVLKKSMKETRVQFWKLFEMEKPFQEMEKPSIIKFEPGSGLHSPASQGA